MAPNLDSFGRDRAAYQENSRQRRIAEREARRYEAQSLVKDAFKAQVPETSSTYRTMPTFTAERSS